MKKNIHPEYGPAKVTCACGHVLETNSTVKAMNVNTCSACHPFFTHQQTFVDTEGRIDAFRRRYGMKGAKPAAPAKEAAKPAEPAAKK